MVIEVFSWYYKRTTWGLSRSLPHCLFTDSESQKQVTGHPLEFFERYVSIIVLVEEEWQLSNPMFFVLISVDVIIAKPWSMSIWSMLLDVAVNICKAIWLWLIPIINVIKACLF